MPIPYLRALSGRERSQAGNRQLASYLAFVAGATNAGGFLAVKQYTSHMTGVVSAMADDIVLGNFSLMLAGAGALLAFTGGAALSALLVIWARRRQLQSEFALPLMLEAALLLLFGVLGGKFEAHPQLVLPLTVLLLCFLMGLQNAMMTKLSRAEIRTTHLTGMVTDIGIELGKLLYWNGPRHGTPVRADWPKLRLLGSLTALFFVGGVAGAFGFSRFGFIATLPLALLLAVLGAVPVADDVLRRWRGPAA